MANLGTISAATGIEEAINALWGANATLSAAVPVLRVITGRMPPSQLMPYIRLDPGTGTNQMRTNLSLYQTQKVSFHIWSDTFDAGQAVAPLIQNAFASNAFQWTSGAVLDMRWDGPPSSRQPLLPEIKAWETVVSFTCSTWEQRTDTYQFTSSSGD